MLFLGLPDPEMESVSSQGCYLQGGDGVYTPLLSLGATAMVCFGEFQLKLHDKVQELIMPQALL